MDRLAPFEQCSLLLADPFGLAPVHDLHGGQVGIPPTR